MNLVNEGVLPPDELDDRDERREEQERARSRETVADIVAAMRDHVVSARAWKAGIKPGVVMDFADRLEAACKFPRAIKVPIEVVPTGNAAAMREALVFLRDQELWMLEGNVRHCVGLTVFGLEQACKIMRGVIEDALSAPPRNCDKMPDIDNLTMHDLAKSPCKSTLVCASREELLALVRWLLAPAAERKGEGDGNK